MPKGIPLSILYAFLLILIETTDTTALRDTAHPIPQPLMPAPLPIHTSTLVLLPHAPIAPSTHAHTHTHTHTQVVCI